MPDWPGGRPAIGPLHVADFEAVRAGKTTDVYFARAVEVLRRAGVDADVRAEVMAKTLSGGGDWAILAGVEELAALLVTLPPEVSVRSMPEGTLFRPHQPVLELSGPYTAWAVHETAILGLLCQASGVATKAARCRLAAGDKTVVSFGARRMHPAISPMLERAAFIGGCDGTSVVLAAEWLGEAPAGTMPHALMLVFAGSGAADEDGATVAAVRAFDAAMPADVRRIALVDTFNDEKFEALNAAAALGEALYGVRLDTPASRRGDFRRILEEVRWELDLRGYTWVKLLASGGIDEAQIRELRDLVDAFGVGTEISNAPAVDFALDIVEAGGRPIAKRGKLAGAKQVWRCPKCLEDVVAPLAASADTVAACPCGSTPQPLLSPLVEQGRPVAPLPRPREIRDYVLDQLSRMTKDEQRKTNVE